jgi:aryl-phospho-beta-D-glucosidase BglC (GH1 family)
MHAGGSVFPSVSGTEIIDASGNQLVLRGAQIASAFNDFSTWKDNYNHLSNMNGIITSKLNPTVFYQMSAVWHMNALRLPTSNWIYSNKHDQILYLNLLDQVVQQANQAGLYVILDLHDDVQSGSPYGSGASVPKPETIDYWKAIATHYINNTQVMFDVFNEPQYPDASTWLNGGGTITGSTGKTAPIVGMQAIVNAIRATGAQQIIIVGGIEVVVCSNPPLTVIDPNIVYTRHAYRDVSFGSSTCNGKTIMWDASWGSFKGQYPLYYGEWALLPNTVYPYQCQGATPANADQKVIDFMNYMTQNDINWTAWEFDSPYLIQDHTNFTPTNLDDPNNTWTCNTTTSTAGMGTIVYLYLQSLATDGNLTVSGNFNGATTSVQLNGHDQTASYSLSVLATNMLTSGSAWHLTIASTRFTNTSNPSIKLSQSASQIVGVSVACNTASYCTQLINNTTYPILLPASNTPPAVSFLQANSYSGMGTFSVTPAINVQIPGNAYAGVYTSTITLAVVSGP